MASQVPIPAGGREHRRQLVVVGDEHRPALAVLEQVAHLLGALVGIDADGHQPGEMGAEVVDRPLGRGRPEDRDPLADLEPELDEAARRPPRLVVELAPGGPRQAPSSFWKMAGASGVRPARSRSTSPRVRASPATTLSVGWWAPVWKVSPMGGS